MIRILLMFFLGFAWGQKEYNINHIIEHNDVLKKRFSNEVLNGRVFKKYGDMKVYMGKVVNGKKESRWVKWKSDGSKDYEEYFKGGKIHSLIKWNADGNKISYGQFWNEKPYNGSFIFQKKVKQGIFSKNKPVLIKLENGKQKTMTWLDYNRVTGMYILKDTVDCMIDECLSGSLWN